VVAQFASATPNGVLFSFARGKTVLVRGVAAPAALVDDIVIV
jgi:hypothetical protein